MDIVTGKTKPDEGVVSYGTPPRDLLRENESAIARLGIGRKFQRPTVFENQTVLENLQMALANQRGPLDVLFYKRSSNDMDRIEALSEEVGLLDHLYRPSGELSHGQKQWLEIGMLLAQNPQVLLVDEPAAGMTVGEREKTTDILKKVAETRAVIVFWLKEALTM